MEHEPVDEESDSACVESSDAGEFCADFRACLFIVVAGNHIRSDAFDVDVDEPAAFKFHFVAIRGVDVLEGDVPYFGASFHKRSFECIFWVACHAEVGEAEFSARLKYA